MPESTARVHTARPERYLKQLASHMGHKVPVILEGRSAEIRFDFGTGYLVATSRHLEMRATASSPDDLRAVEDVLGSHLVRFGERDGLSVSWQAPALAQ